MKSPEVHANDSPMYAGLPSKYYRKGLSFRGNGHKQSGFTLIELAVVSAVVLVSTIWIGGTLVKQGNDKAADATGAYMLSIRSALNDGLKKHNADFAKNDLATIRNDFPGLSNPTTRDDGVILYTITLADLKKGGFLNAGFPTKTPLKQDIALNIYQLPGCTPTSCTVEAMASTVTPIRPDIAGGNADVNMVGRVLGSLNGFGGASQLANPTVIKGTTFAQRNPIPGQDGIVAVYASSKTITQGNIDVGKDPAGNPCVHIDTAGRIDVNCQGLINTKDLAASGTVTAGTVNATNAAIAGTTTANYLTANNVAVAGSTSTNYLAANNVDVAGTTNTSTLNATSRVNSPIGVIDAMFVQNMLANSIGTNNIMSNGRIRTAEYMQIDGYAPEGGGCSPNGLQGNNGAGLILSCQNGVWTRNGGGIKDRQIITWSPPYRGYAGGFDTGFSTADWSCALTGVTGKFAGGGETLFINPGSPNWIFSGSSNSDQGITGQATCTRL